MKVMANSKQIGYLAVEKGTINCACKGENLLVMNNPVEMKKFVRRHFKLKNPDLQKVYSDEVIKGLKAGGHYLFTEKSYKDFTGEQINNHPQIFPPHRLIVAEPVGSLTFYQVSWDSYTYNTPNQEK